VGKCLSLKTLATVVTLELAKEKKGQALSFLGYFREMLCLFCLYASSRPLSSNKLAFATRIKG